MTLKNSWKKIFNIDLRERSQIFIMMLVIGVLMIPFSAYYDLSMVFSLNYDTAEAVKIATSNMNRFTDMKSEVFISFTFISAIILGIGGLDFLFNKEKTDFYLSFPVKKKDHYIGRFFGGLTIYAVSLLVIDLLLLGVISAYNLKGNFFREISYNYLFNISYFLLIYSISMFAAIITGKVIISVLAMLTISMYGSFIYGLYIGLKSVFFKTFLGDDSITKLFTYSFIGRFIFEKHPIYEPFLFAAVFIAAGLFLSTKRKAETAGLSVAFKIDVLVKYLISIPFGIIVGMILGSSMPHSETSRRWLYIGTVVFSVLVMWIVDSILNGSIKSIAKRKIDAFIIPLIAVCILMVFSNYGKKYDLYVPEEKEIKAIYVKDSGLQSMVRNTSHYNGDYYENNSLKRGYKTDKISIESIKELAKACEKVNYEDEVNIVGVSIDLKNKKKFEREYCVNIDDAEKILANTYKDEKYLRRVFGVNSLMNEDIILFDIEYEDNNEYSSKNITEGTALSKELVDAYRLDLQNIEFTREINNPSLFTISGNMYKEKGSVILLVTENFENTLRVLKENGLEAHDGKKDLLINFKN